MPSMRQRLPPGTSCSESSCLQRSRWRRWGLGTAHPQVWTCGAGLSKMPVDLAWSCKRLVLVLPQALERLGCVQHSIEAFRHVAQLLFACHTESTITMCALHCRHHDWGGRAAASGRWRPAQHDVAQLLGSSPGFLQAHDHGSQGTLGTLGHMPL